MDISSRRFSIKTNPACPSEAVIRDRNAPYHCHTVPLSELPTVAHMAAINEDEFNKEIARLIYWQKGVAI